MNSKNFCVLNCILQIEFFVIYYNDILQLLNNHYSDFRISGDFHILKMAWINLDNKVAMQLKPCFGLHESVISLTYIVKISLRLQMLELNLFKINSATKSKHFNFVPIYLSALSTQLQQQFKFTDLFEKPQVFKMNLQIFFLNSLWKHIPY